MDVGWGSQLSSIVLFYVYMASIYTTIVNEGNSIVKHCAKRERLSARRDCGHSNKLAEGIGIV